MKMLTKAGAVLVVLGAGSLGACGSDDEDNGAGGGATGGGGGAAGSADASPGGTGATGTGGRTSGTGGTSSSTGGTGPAPTTCGGETCDLGGVSNFATVCCTEDDACGMEVQLASGCIALDQPGGIDPTCQGLEVMGFALTGCCGPSGCGTFLGSTCVPNLDLGLEAVECDYDPSNTCMAILDVPCDGAEDCPGGQQCCGKVEGTTYTAFGCFDSCETAGADAGQGTMYLELCHEGDTCTNSAYTCGTSDFLPDFLLRCYETTSGAPTGSLSSDANAINCGGDTCGAGEKCCVRPPKDPYCAPAGEDCACTQASERTDGGAEGGVSDAGGSDASAPVDASTD